MLYRHGTSVKCERMLYGVNHSGSSFAQLLWFSNGEEFLEPDHCCRQHRCYPAVGTFLTPPASYVAVVAARPLVVLPVDSGFQWYLPERPTDFLNQQCAEITHVHTA